LIRHAGSAARWGVIGARWPPEPNTAIMRTMDVFYAFPSILLGGRDLRRDGWRQMINGIISLSLGVHPRDVPRRGNRDRRR